MKRIKLARMDCEKVSGEIGDFVIGQVRCTGIVPVAWWGFPVGWIPAPRRP